MGVLAPATAMKISEILAAYGDVYKITGEFETAFFEQALL